MCDQETSREPISATDAKKSKQCSSGSDLLVMCGKFAEPKIEPHFHISRQLRLLVGHVNLGSYYKYVYQ